MRVSYVGLNTSENTYTNTSNNYSNECKSMNFTSQFSSKMPVAERWRRTFDVFLGVILGIGLPIWIVSEEVSKTKDFSSAIHTIFANDNLGHTVTALALLVCGGLLIYKAAFFRDKRSS